MPPLTISVAMCTFNGERFLNAQLESIAAQGRPPDELVICDDGSTDASQEIIRQFAQRSTFPVRFRVNERNLGSTKNFEQAISLCQGTIVALADQDDVWYPHKLARMEKAFQEPGIVAAFSDADLIDDDSRPLGSRLWPTFAFNLEKQQQFIDGRALKVLIRHPVVTGATMALRRQWFDLMVPIPAEHIHDSWISFLLAACGWFEVISEPLMQYRQHEGQQLGPGPLSLREQTARARRTGADSYLEQIERFHQLDERLEGSKDNFPYGARAQELIKKKVFHLTYRAQLPVAIVARLPKLIRELLNLGYWHYSAGWKSVAKDLMMR